MSSEKTSYVCGFGVFWVVGEFLWVFFDIGLLEQISKLVTFRENFG